MIPLARGAAFGGPVRHVYVHVPYCAARCDYCDFYAEVAPPARATRAATLDAYVAAVAAEWELERATRGVRHLETLYVGGGTPALLGADRLERLRAAFAAWLTPRAEVTVETNPDEADGAFVEWAAQRGVRVSLGVQSFAARLRARLGRRPVADPASAVRRLRAAGVSDLGIDLIHGIAGQTGDDVEADLKQVARLEPDHVSWYELDVAAGTPLARRLGGGAGAAPGMPGEDDRAALYDTIVRGLERLGYGWYEVSNFARPGRRARHNMAYWRARPYLGLGAGSVSTVGHHRWRDAPDAAAYVAALVPVGASRPAAARDARLPQARRSHAAPPRTSEELDDATLARERLMLASRCGLAVPLADVSDAIDSDAVAPLVEAGLLSLHSGTIRVTRKGRRVANEVCVRLFRD